MALTNHWKFDEPSGEVTFLNEINSNTLTTGNATFNVARASFGTLSGQISPDSPTGHLNMNTAVSTAGAFSINFWADFRDTDFEQFIVADKTNNSSYLSAFPTGSTGIFKILVDGSGNELTLNTGITLNSQHMYSFTRDTSSNIRTYVDTVLQTNTGHITGIFKFDRLFGASGNVSGITSGGLFDDFRTYDTTNNLNAIKTLYQEARPLFLLTPVVTSPVLGTVTEAETITATAAVKDDDSLTYEWLRADDSSGTNMKVIFTATSSNTYVTGVPDRGKYIACRITASNDYGYTLSTTAYLGAVTAIVTNLFDGIITSAFKTLHVDMLESLLADSACSVLCTLQYEGSKWEDCPNCVENVAMGRSSSSYTAGGPIPFTFGGCPYCNGAGRITTNETESIYLAPIWDSQEWISLSAQNNTAQAPNVTVQTISKIETYENLSRAKSVLIDTSISGFGHNRFERQGDPEICGLGNGSFVLVMWSKIS
jgi:hypothetical protein